MSLSRGYVSFQSVLIDEMASKYVDMLPKDDRLQLASKRNPWHITILTKDELENLSAAKKSELYQNLELFAENLDDLVDIGLGKGVENGSVVYFVVIWWPVVQEIRELLGLGKKQVHLTLAYNDCDLHSVDKGFSSPVRVGKDVDEDKVKQLLAMSRRNFDEESLPELLEYLLSCTDSQRADVYDLLAMHSLRNKNYAKCEMACIQLLDLEASLRARIRIADYFFAIKSWRLACLAFFMTLEWGPFQDAILIHIGDRLKKCANKIGTIWPALVTEDDLKELKAWRHVLGSFHDFIEIPQELLFPMLTEIVLPDKCELLVETRNHFCLIKGEEKDDLRMPRFFTWLVHGLVAGMSTPRNALDILLLERLGIETVVSLTKEDPLPEEWFSTTSVKHHFFPVENYGVPESFDPVDYYTQLILRSAHSMQMEQRCGKGVLVHCGGGKGRAGTFLACYLLRFGLEFPMLLCSDCIKTVEDERMMCNNSGCAMAQPPVMSANEAIALLRDLRPGSIETEVQERYIQRYGSYCWKRLEQRADRKAEPSDKLTIIGKLPTRPPLILCCGFPASGKSWFSKTLTSGGYTRISQDDLGSRSTCENALSICVRNGEAVVLDRCNPTREDRKMWWKLAGQPAQSVCVHFSADSEICY
jgi:atypical dual specificity phosphatase